MVKNKTSENLLKNKRKKTIINILLMANILLGLIIIVFSFFSFTPKYYVINDKLEHLELKMLSKPIVTDNGIKDWVIKAVNDTLALDFRTYYDTLKKSKIFYDEIAFDNLLNSLQQNKIIELIKNNRVICSPIIQKKPVLLDKGMMQGNYIWILELEFKLSYESSKGVEKVQNLIANVIIQRADTSKYSSGINIKQIILEEKSL